MRLYSRSGYDWTKRLASLAEALAGHSLHVRGDRRRAGLSRPPMAAPISERLQAAIGVGPAARARGLRLRSPAPRRRGSPSQFPSSSAGCSSPSWWRARACRACTWCRGSMTAPSCSRRPSGTGWRASFRSARGVCLPLGTIPRLGEDEDGSVASGEPGAVAVVRKASGRIVSAATVELYSSSPAQD